MAKNKRKNTASKTKTKSIIKPIKKAAVETIPFYDSSFWKKNWWKALIIFLLPFALYYQSTNFGYVLDDQIVVSENKFTKKGFEGIGDLLTNESMTGYFGEQKDLVEGNRYRPLSLTDKS